MSVAAAAPSESLIEPAVVATPASVVRKPRDLRLDVARGLALVAITVNHVVPAPGSGIAHYRFGQWFAFNFADVFVFVSGMACGFAYPRLVKTSFAEAQLKAVRRAGEIWLIGLAATLTAAAAVLLIGAFGGAYDVHPLMSFERSLLSGPDAWLSLLTLGPVIGLVGILRFYVVMLPLVPAVVWLYGKSRLAAVVVSILPWLAIQGLDLTNKLPGLVQFWGTSSIGNPLAWQFLFCIGIFISMERKRGGFDRYTSTVWHSAILGLAVASLLLGDFLRQTQWMHFHLDQKSTLGPMRVWELLAVTLLVGRFVRPQANGLTRLPGRWLMTLGRHSLPVFGIGLVVSFVLTHLNAVAGVGRPGYLLSCLFAAVAVTCLGLLLAWWGRRGAVDDRFPSNLDRRPGAV